MGGVPVIIPGDGATHQIEACVDEAWGSNSETTILSGSYLSVADPGNRVATVQGTILSATVDFSSTPVNSTAISGLSETIPAASASHTVLVSVGLRANRTHYRPCVLLDTTGPDGTVISSLVTAGAGPWSDSDPVSWGDMAGIPVVIPAGSQSHKISACVQAQGSTDETTILAGYLSVVDPS
jgi:hypothetical protein